MCISVNLTLIAGLKFFSSIYSNSYIYLRSSIKYSYNLFFSKYMLGLNFSHNLYPHFFINTKLLKIKILKSCNIFKLEIYLYYFIFTFIFFMFMFMFI